jgi:hypothetical protein
MNHDLAIARLPDPAQYGGLKWEYCLGKKRISGSDKENLTLYKVNSRFGEQKSSISLPDFADKPETQSHIRVVGHDDGPSPIHILFQASPIASGYVIF